MRKRLIKNTIWGVLELGVMLGAGIILPRIFVRGLNMEYYGVFLTLSLFSSYGILSMLDFGMGGAATTFVAKYHHTDTGKLRKLWTFSVLYFSVIAALAVIAGIGVIRWQSADITQKFTALGIPSGVLVPTLLMLCVAFLSYIGESFLFGFNDFGYVKSVTIAQNILRIIIVLAIIKTSKSLYEIMWIMAFLSLARLILITRYLTTKYSEFTTFSRFGSSDAMEWFKYSIVLMVSSITGFVFNAYTKILVSATLPINMMGNYDVATKPQTFIRGLLSAMISAITPVAAHYHAADSHGKLTEILFRGSFWLNIFLFPPLLFVTIFINDLIRIWLGSGYEGISGFARISISYLFIFAFAASLSNMVIVGMGEAKKYLPVQIAASILTVISSFICGKYFGLKGIISALAFGSAVANIGCLAVLLKILKVSMRQLTNELLLPTMALYVIPGLIILFFLKPLSGAPLFPMAVGFMIYTVLTYLAYYLSILDSREKDFLKTATRDFLVKLTPAR